MRELSAEKSSVGTVVLALRGLMFAITTIEAQVIFGDRDSLVPAACFFGAILALAILQCLSSSKNHHEIEARYCFSVEGMPISLLRMIQLCSSLIGRADNKASSAQRFHVCCLPSSDL